VSISVPGYKIEHLIAEGATASIYLAIQESLGRHVAIKLLRKIDNPDQLNRFLNEGQIIASLNHRNIINIHDVGVTDDGRPYISMEYLEGGDLDARIQKKVDPEDALQWLEAIGNCLDFVHRKGIIHRDIKPGNILIHKDGTLILSDFGTAKQEESDAKLTLEGCTFGSPYYISPEQAASKELDRRTDIYSLGIVLYEMLTGNKPYKGDSHIETIVAHLSEPLPDLPPELHRYHTLIKKMIAKSPDDRFTTAAEMVRFVQRLRKPVKNAWRVTWVPTGAVAIAAEMVRFVQQLRKPLKNAQRMTWVSTGAGAVILGIGVTLFMRHSIISDHNEHQTTAGTSISGGAIPESSPDIVAMPSPEPGDLASETPVPSSNNEQHIENLLSQAATAIKEYRLTTPKNNNAYNYYQRVLELHPQHKKALEGITRVADAYADRAESKLDQFDYEAAKKYLHRGLTIQPENTRLLGLQKKANIGRIIAQAATALKEYRLTTPKNNNAHYYYQRVLDLHPKHKKALEGITRVANAYADLAESKLDQFDYEAAKKYLHRGLTIQPENTRLLGLQKKANIGRNLAQAATALKEYRLTTPKNNNAHYYYQRILELHPQHEKALEGITRVADAYADLAESKLDQFEYKAAKEYLNRGLMIQPDNTRLQELQKNTNAFRDAPGRIWKKILSPFS